MVRQQVLLRSWSRRGPCVGVGAGHGGADDENNPQNVGAAPTAEDHAMIDDEDAAESAQRTQPKAGITRMQLNPSALRNLVDASAS